MAIRRSSELRFDMDFDAQSPALTSAALDIDRVSHRAPSAHHRDITVFDTADERLLRAGVVVAHRVVSGVGEWYLAAPSWQPRLPAERVEPFGSTGGLPEAFVRLITPITRGATIGPVAALECRTREYLVRSGDDTQLGVIVDELVTVRRGESTRTRYREVRFTPGAGMAPAQVEHVIESMRSVGASMVERFPTLQHRLGAPATGLTDFPVHQPLRHNATMEELVSAVFAADLWAVTSLLLDAGRDRRPHVASLNAQLESVSRDLNGLAHVLEPEWREQVENLLLGLPFEELPDAVAVALQVADALVWEVRAPKLGDVAGKEAAPLLLHRAQQAALILAERCSALTVGSADRQWEAALGAAGMLAVSSAVAEPVLGKPLRRIVRRLQAITEHLRACNSHWTASPADLAGLTVEEAFTLGRQVERGRATTMTERGRFVALWPDRLDELRRLLSKAKKA
ncbi:hypothetical protein [Tessaracoccus sp.]